MTVVSKTMTRKVVLAFLNRTAFDLHSLLRKFNDTGIPEKFKERGAYAIYGSGPMALHGIRESEDMDVLVSPEVWDFLVKNGYKPSLPDKIPLDMGLDAFNRWTNGINEHAVLSNAERANIGTGYWFASLQDVYEWKKRRAKEKDLKDVLLIENYWREHATSP